MRFLFFSRDLTIQFNLDYIYRAERGYTIESETNDVKVMPVNTPIVNCI